MQRRRFKRFFPFGFVGLLICGSAIRSDGATRSGHPVAFPDDPSVLNVQRDLSAAGDGVADDTVALQKGLEASSNRGRGGTTKILFIPNGTYRLTSNLVVRAGVGPWVYGQSRDGVIIRLDDGVPTNITAVIRTHPSDTKASSADFFMRNFRNLTLDAGNNPTVDGIHWYGNNSSILQNVRVIGTGRVGINSGFLGQNGPNLIQDALVEGSFETGIRCAWSWGQTLSRVTVRHARQEGVYVNATAVGIEDLIVEATPVALHNEYPNDWTWWGGVVALVGARFTGGNAQQPAVTNTSVLWARQLNPEGDSDVGLVQNHGGKLWALGLKHEGRGARFLTDKHGQTEILGLFNYAPDIAKDDTRPAFDIVKGGFSAAGVREISFGNTYPVKVREVRGDDVRTEKGGGWIGWSLYSGWSE